MPTFIKTGFWDKLINNNPSQAKAPKGWFNLDRFVEDKLPAPKYKVYTALLTQSGGDDPNSRVDGDLSIGVTYYIEDNSGGADWTNVGAPNNNIGTWFVATGTTPNSWGISGTLQVNYGAPVVTVLENTIGNIWFEFYYDGAYLIKTDNDWDFNKLWYGIPGVGNTGVINVNPGNIKIMTEGVYFLILGFNNDYSGVVNGQLVNTPIEIRVYN